MNTNLKSNSSRDIIHYNEVVLHMVVFVEITSFFSVSMPSQGDLEY